MGISVDSFSSAGHPGYPQDSSLFEKNRIYSNNLNPYTDDVGFEPTFPIAPVGTGLAIGGGNANLVKKNHIFDNWRFGTFLFSVADGLNCDLAQPQQTCSPEQFDEQSHSHRNRFFKNVMGVAPEGKRSRGYRAGEVCRTGSTLCGATRGATRTTAGTRTPASMGLGRASRSSLILCLRLQ